MTKLSKSQFVSKMRHDLSRFDTAMKERNKDVILKDYDRHVCRGNWKIIYSAGEKRRERV